LRALPELHIRDIFQCKNENAARNSYRVFSMFQQSTTKIKKTHTVLVKRKGKHTEIIYTHTHSHHAHFATPTPLHRIKLHWKIGKVPRTGKCLQLLHIDVCKGIFFYILRGGGGGGVG